MALLTELLVITVAKIPPLKISLFPLQLWLFQTLSRISESGSRICILYLFLINFPYPWVIGKSISCESPLVESDRGIWLFSDSYKLSIQGC